MAVPTAQAQEIGATIRGARAAARLTQAELGRSCGYSPSAVSRLEAGTLRPAPEILQQIAATLSLDPQRLGLSQPGTAQPHAPAATLAGDVMRAQQEEPVRRRELLAGVAGYSASLVTPIPARAAEAPRPPEADPVAALEAALYTPAPAAPMPPARLGRALAAVRADFTAARYGALGGALPGFLAAAEATRDTASGRAREEANTVVARGYVLATELAVKQHSDIAWATADRALTAARASGDPVVTGEAARVLAITMRRAGRPAAAVDLLRRTAATLSTEPGAAPRAVAATLLMTAAYTAACSRDTAAAHDLMTGADEAVRRIPPQSGPATQLFTVDATAAQLDLYWIGVHNALHTPDAAVPYARRLTPAALPTAERRARLGGDTARMWHQLGDHRRTFTALRLVEQAAPEEARRPALRALTADLLYSPAPLPGVREFARRTGAA